MGPGDNDSMEDASDEKGEDMNDDDSSDAAGDRTLQMMMELITIGR